MALAVLFSSLGRIEAHDPLLRYMTTLEQHATPDGNAHGHSHNHEADAEPHGGVAHKHGFVDHSHEATGALVNRLPTVPFPPQVHRQGTADFRLQNQSFRLDRPPKAILNS